MFVQVILGRTDDAAGLEAALDRWMVDLQPTAVGWLGSTAGVTPDGRVVCVARFASEEAARRNSDRPEQTAWWEELVALLRDVEVEDHPQATQVLAGGSDVAGFVQVIRGRTRDVRRMREIAAEMDRAPVRRPDLVGGVDALRDDGRFTTVLHFTSEEEARVGERMEPPPEVAGLMDEMRSLTDDVEFLDLPRPLLASPATRATAVVRSGYRAFARGDVCAVLEMMADDITFTTQDTVPVLGGTRRGREEVAAFFQLLATTWDQLSVNPESCAQAGGRVTVLGRHEGRTRGGTSFTLPFAHDWTVHGDRVTGFREHLDSLRMTQLLQEAAGVPAQAAASDQPASAARPGPSGR